MKNVERREFVKIGLAGTGALLMGINHSPAEAKSVVVTKKSNILDYGAVGDGKQLNTAAIQKAIDACFRNGGGQVNVPAGTFLTGSVVLKTGVHLHLEQGAVLLASPQFKDFPKRTVRTPVRYQRDLMRCLIYAQGEKDISVTGPGILDGNARLDGSGEFKEKNPENPLLIWFDECENVLIKDVAFRHSVWWTQAYTRCHHVHVDHITVTENYFHNADGVDIIDTDDFVVENCDINSNDDGICLKSYTPPGCNRGTIRKNKVRSLCNAIKMGTDSSGGFRNILIEDNEIWQTVISGLALQIVDGGTMENITVRRITMNGIGTPFHLCLGNRNRKMPNSRSIQNGIMRQIRISDIKAIVHQAERYNDEERKRHNYPVHTSSICGVPGNYIQEVTIENVDIEIRGGFPPATADDTLRQIPEVGNKYPENRMYGTLPAYGFYLRHVKGIHLNNISVSILQADGRPAFLLDDVHDSEFDEIAVESRTPTAVFAMQQNCSGVSLHQTILNHDKS
ncbi:glycoside hydrolase family 28 protein [Larkinella harenae]